MTAYYNEIDPYAAQWLRNLISKNLIAPGDVDERSIVDVQPDDLKSYTQCHFFAGIGGWSLAARLAGWPDHRPLWTGSCPCQPFSEAGRRKGQADERHLWPTFFELIRARRPDVVMGEQVAAAVGQNWLDGVHSDLEGIGYACGAAVVPACAVDAPHRRDRLWFVADTSRERCDRREDATGGHQSHGAAAGWRQGADRLELCCEDDAAAGSSIPYAESARQSNEPERAEPLHQSGPIVVFGTQLGTGRRGDDRPAATRGSDTTCGRQAWAEAGWAIGADGKARRVEPSVRLLAHGVPARVGKLRAYGNAIVPQVAAEVIGAYLDIGRSA